MKMMMISVLTMIKRRIMSKRLEVMLKKKKVTTMMNLSEEAKDFIPMLSRILFLFKKSLHQKMRTRTKNTKTTSMMMNMKSNRLRILH